MKSCKLALFALFVIRVGYAETLDGTNSIVFKQTQYTFGSGGSAVGGVYLGAGFVIPSGSEVTLNTLFPVAGPISLGNTGTLHLEGQLTLGAGTSITHGGSIDGGGNTIFLQDNLTIPAGVRLACTSDVIIDGQGHELLFEGGTSGGQLLINGASGTIITLRNIVVRGLMNYASGSSISFGSNDNQKLVLDNATCILAGDMTYRGGSLDIRGNSTIKGWYMFDYQAPYDLTINEDSMLVIDMHTTFKYNPSDRLRTHLVMPGTTAHLFLCGATLDVPSTTGLMLIYGHLIIDHKTVFYGNSATREAGSIMFGDGDAEHDLYIDIMPAAGISVSDGFLTYNNSI